MLVRFLTKVPPYQAGETAGLPDAVARQLAARKKVEILGDDKVAPAPVAAVVPAAPVTKPMEPAAPSVGPYTLKLAGPGQFRVVDAAGNTVAGPMPSAEAKAEAARMNGEG